MALLDLFIASSIPVLKVLIITGLGLFLALDNVAILEMEARKHLNNVVFYVFNPALVGSNLAGTITSESMKKLWFMPVNVLLTFIIGSGLGWIVLQLTRPPSHLRGLILGCCAAGNLGNMPLIIIPAVCRERGSPFGSPESCEKYGLAYVSLSMAVGAIYLWTYVYNLVRLSSGRSIKEIGNNCKSPAETSTRDYEHCTEPLLSQGLEVQCTLPFTGYDRRAELDTSVTITQKLGLLFGKANLKTIFAPSTIGAIVGFTVGLIAPIRKLMIGDGALHVIQDSASLVGDGAIPTITLIVGANLLRGIKGRGVEKSVLFSIVFARYAVLPITGVFIIRGAFRFGLIPHEPLYQFVLLLQFAVPPAMNIGIITQLFGAGESECSVIMMWTYGLASISLTLWSTFFMWLVS